jgi:hypothetical protein
MRMGAPGSSSAALESAISLGSIRVTPPEPITSIALSLPITARRQGIDAEAQCKRIEGECGKQAAEPITGMTALVDDHPVGEAKPRRKRGTADPWCGSLAAGCQHVLAQDCGSSGNSAHGQSVGIASAQQAGK